jgi:4-aminobutyrate aminotransferase
MGNARRMGDLLMDRMREWPGRFRHVGQVRGLGLMIGIEFVRDGEGKERAPELRDRVVDMAFQRGLLVLGAGPNSIRLSPPLIVSEDQCHFALDTLESCLAGIESH